MHIANRFPPFSTYVLQRILNASGKTGANGTNTALYDSSEESDPMISTLIPNPAS